MSEQVQLEKVEEIEVVEETKLYELRKLKSSDLFLMLSLIHI